MRGSCLCGGVIFEVTPPLRPVVACHCSQCRKTSGHYWASSSVPLDRFRLVASGTLAWYRSSEIARRGFCARCGSSLFWQPDAEPRIAFAAGALDGPTGLHLATHIYTEDAGDYYAPEGPPPAPSRAKILQGACLCGANRFTLPGPMGAVGACHCRQCRKTSGHYAASFDVDEATVVWHTRSLREYTAAGGARRGFCPSCGASLTFRSADGFSIEAGAIAAPTGGYLVSHIFTAEKGDYYALTDGLPQHARWD